MTSATDILIDGFGRIREVVHRVVATHSPQVLAERVDSDANSIAWLVWHLTRVQDDHVSEVAGTEQVWLSEGWNTRFGLPFPPEATGYAQSSDEVGLVQGISAELLRGYHDAVHAQTVGFVEGLSDDDLARIVDERWTPAVTLAVRLVSVISDDLQHAGQAAFIAGMLGRRRHG
ncbi:DUF664 domain-containing protein [Leifsonia kafniensis]|uniref:DUF664 domain-containing protein n=1 Tax=Leifsonia kafniensis TaxID=475957 RepID=A0ABP7K3H2_9MICO